MYIFGKSPVDKLGRVNVKSFFPSDDTPEKIYLGVDVGTEMILVHTDEDIGPLPKIPVFLDKKGHITLPSWIRKELPEETFEFFFIFHDGKKFLSPKTGSIL